MNKSMLAGAALIAAAAVAVPVMAWSDDNPNSAPQAEQGQDGHGNGGMWRHEGMRADMRGEMHGEGRWGENRSPQQKCEEHLARPGSSPISARGST